MQVIGGAGYWWDRLLVGQVIGGQGIGGCKLLAHNSVSITKLNPPITVDFQYTSDV